MTESKKRGRPAATESRTEREDLVKRLFCCQIASSYYESNTFSQLADRSYEAADAYFRMRASRKDLA